MKKALFIDGSNLFGGLYELIGAKKTIVFSEFIELIRPNLPVDDVFFYGTYMRSDDTKSEKERLKANNQKALFDSVKQCEGINLYWGHLSRTSGKEKGVDVHMAIDIALSAALKKYNEITIMTGDADLQYAVEIAKQYGVGVNLAALSTRFPLGIALRVNNCAVFDVGEFFKKNVLEKYHIKRKNIQVFDISELVRDLENKGPLFPS
ncbi:MAG TPA: NYN domain-containing protein, partial [Candidatus Saccharimonadales bacterium]|nr:NYN domain-containing protein [Candidatus Saccharimonadales bacterium]